MKRKLPYGIKNGVLMSISDVESGLACKCVCPSCGVELVARKGEVKTHHFAHHKTDECEHGFETALHLAAKDLIVKEKKFLLPAMYYTESDGEGWSEVSHRLTNPGLIEFDKVELEVAINDYKPDVIGYIGNKKLLIEIAVTHFVDDDKKTKIERDNLACVEIDLSSLLNGFTEDKLRKFLFDFDHDKKWIHNPKKDSLYQKYQYKVKQEAMERARINLLKRNDYKKRLNKLKQKGFDLIGVDRHYEVYCPKSVNEKSWRMKRNHLIEKIRCGAFWNGKVYGKKYYEGFGDLDGLSESGCHVFINEERINLTINQCKQFLFISNKAKQYYSKCEGCSFFKGEIEGFSDDDSDIIICSYMKEKINQ